jgi:Holliday junction resolvasome RuvABC DNA-binding subunit
VLGYSRSEASLAAAKVDGTLSVEEIIRQALRLLAK